MAKSESYLLESVNRYRKVVEDLKSHKSARNTQKLAKSIWGYYRTFSSNKARDLHMSNLNRLQPIFDGDALDHYKDDVSVTLTDGGYGFWKYVHLQNGKSVFHTVDESLHEFSESFIPYSYLSSNKLQSKDQFVKEFGHMSLRNQGLATLFHKVSKDWYQDMTKKIKKSLNEVIEDDIKDNLKKVTSPSELKYLFEDNPAPLFKVVSPYHASVYVETVGVRDLLLDIPLEARNHIQHLIGQEVLKFGEWKDSPDVGGLFLLEDRLPVSQVMKIAVNLPSLAEMYLMLKEPKKYVSNFLSSREQIFNYKFKSA